MKVIQKEREPFEAIRVNADNLAEVTEFLGDFYRRCTLDKRNKIKKIFYCDEYLSHGL
jgi:hypothetical protein